MAGAATVVCLQQLKGILGLEHFTKSTDLVSVMRSIFSQTHEVRTIILFVLFSPTQINTHDTANNFCFMLHRSLVKIHMKRIHI